MVATLAQHTLKVPRVVRLQSLSGAGQIKVVQARDPEAQRGGLDQYRPGAVFGFGKGAHLGVGFQPGLGFFQIQGTAQAVDTPVVHGHGHVKQPGVATGKVKVDDAAHLGRFGGAGKQHVVAEQVAVGRALRQGAIGVAVGKAALFLQNGLDQLGLARIQERQNLGNGGLPPAQAAQIGLFQREVLGSQVGLSLSPGDLAAVFNRRLGLVTTTQARHNRARLAVHDTDAFAIAAGHGLGHRHTFGGQVVHQLDVEGQLVQRQDFKQRQNVLALGGAQKVIGVFNAGGNAT